MLDPEQSELPLVRDLPVARWVVMAHRSRLSMFGAVSEPVRFAGGVRYYETQWEAERAARRFNKDTQSPNVIYHAEMAP